LAAPASFLSAEAFWQLAAASFSHFVMKLLSAAPANFLAVAWSWQLGSAKAADEQSTKAGNNAMRDFIPVLPLSNRFIGIGRIVATEMATDLYHCNPCPGLNLKGFEPGYRTALPSQPEAPVRRAEATGH
jgi:hypothetical protein